MAEAYHHGNLREELLAAATLTLEEIGYETLSIRKLAQAAGVSPAAPYRHFENREQLLVGVALAGALRLERAYEDAVASHSGAEDRLRAICHAYIGLARSSPQLFRLMFDSDIVVGNDPLPEWLKATQRAFEIFESVVASVAPDADAVQVRHQTAVVWATIHGLSSMQNHGRLHRFRTRGDTIDQLIDYALDTLTVSCRSAADR